MWDTWRPLRSSSVVCEFREGIYFFDLTTGEGAPEKSLLGTRECVQQEKLGVSLIHCSHWTGKSLHTQGGGMMWLWEGRAGRHNIRALLSAQKPNDCNRTGPMGEASQGRPVLTYNPVMCVCLFVLMKEMIKEGFSPWICQLWMIRSSGYSRFSWWETEQSPLKLAASSPWQGGWVLWNLSEKVDSSACLCSFKGEGK